MNWTAESVLITGAGGFIGSHLTEHLIDLGARVTAFVRYNSRNDWGLLSFIPKEKLDAIKVVAGDLRDVEAVTRAAREASVIFHLGALIAIPYSYIHPRETIETNLTGTLNVMTAAREVRVQRVVHTSTSEVYGTALYVPIDEKHPLQGQSPYSASKIGADMIAESFYRSFRVPVATIRPFNTFGPRQSARAVIPTIVSQVLGPSASVVLGSLHPTRDYTYVADTVEAFVRVAESDQSIGQVTNVGCNFEMSIGDIARKVMAIAGVQKEIRLDEKRVRPPTSEVDRLWCDNAKARQVLGWDPRVTFDDGLARTIDWISAHQSLYRPNLYNV